MDNLRYNFLDKLKDLPFVEEIYLYGSRARKDNQLRSDIDIAISAPNATKNDWVQVMNIIANADTLLKIDCIWLEELSDEDSLKKSIERDKKLIFRRQKK